MLPLDVSASQQRRHDQMLRSLCEPARAALVAGLWKTGRQMAEAGVRARNPGASEPRIRWYLTALLYGEATATRLHGTKPLK